MSRSSTSVIQDSRPPHGLSTNSRNAAPTTLDRTASTGDELPTYDALAAAEPRFGRWREWIGKRGAETRDLRQQERASGENARTGPSGWSLPGFDDAPAADDHAPLFTSQQEQAYFHTPRVVNADPPSPISPSKTPSKIQPSLVPGPGHRPLTPNTALHPIGSRFVRLDLPFQPLCGLPLPMPTLARRGTIRINRQAEPLQAIDRFLLIGTSDGLFVADLVPGLSSASLSDLTLEHCAVKQIWSGLAVHDLAFFDEPRPRESRRSAGSAGIIVGVVSPTGQAERHGEERSVRLWPLQAIINLARWRVFTESSHVLDLASPAQAKGKRSSALSGFKNLFQPQPPASPRVMSVTSPVDAPPSKEELADHASLPGTLSRSELKKLKGKARAVEEENGYVVVSAAVSPTLEASGTSFSRELTTQANGSRSLSVQTSRSLTAPPDRKLDELPHEWATSCVTLSLPKGHAPIVSARLLLPPPRAQDTMRRVDSDDELSRTADPSWLYLAVSTKAAPPSRTALVYIFESRPGEKRTWALGPELYVPATPRLMELIRLSAQSSSRHCDKASSARHLPQAKSSTPIDDLSLFVATRDRAIAITLADSTVHELEAPADGRIRSGSRASDPTVKRPNLPNNRRHSALYDGPENISAESLTSHGHAGGLPWTSCFELRLPWLPPHATSCYILTRGQASHFCSTPLSSTKLKSLATVYWRAMPVRVIALVPAMGVEARRVALVAFTATGIEVQEGILADDRYQWTTPPSLVPAGTTAPDEEDRDPTASYDWGMPTGYLCAGDGNTSLGRGAISVSAPTSCFFWSEGMGEYKLFFLG